MRVSTIFPAFALLAAACSDLATSVAPTPAPGPTPFRAEVRCTAEVAGARLTCEGDGAEGAGPERSLIIGGQNVYVRMISSGAGYNPADSIFQVTVSVRNLMAQAFGTPDGETDTGVRVFFSSGPTAASGSGSVTVHNADGEAFFLQAGQPFFSYAGPLRTGVESKAKVWQFKMDPEVTRFVFTVLVEGELPHESSLLLIRPEPVGGGNAVWAASANEVFVVGTYGGLARYTGGSWVSDDSPTQNWLGDVWGSSATNVFAVGGQGTILHWNGTFWELMISPFEEEQECHYCLPPLYSVWGFGPDNVYAVGNGVVVHYDGLGWAVQDTLSVFSLYGLWGSAPDDMFAVGQDGAIWHYDGTSWTAMASGTTEYLWTVWGLSSTDVYAAAANGVLHYDGTSWSPLPGLPECDYRGVWGSAPDDLFVSGFPCGLWHWDGSTWAYMDSVGDNGNLWGTGPHHLLISGVSILVGTR